MSAASPGQTGVGAWCGASLGVHRGDSQALLPASSQAFSHSSRGRCVLFSAYFGGVPSTSAVFVTSPFVSYLSKGTEELRVNGGVPHGGRVCLNPVPMTLDKTFIRQTLPSPCSGLGASQTGNAAASRTFALSSGSDSLAGNPDKEQVFRMAG